MSNERYGVSELSDLMKQELQAFFLFFFLPRLFPGIPHKQLSLPLKASLERLLSEVQGENDESVVLIMPLKRG